LPDGSDLNELVELSALDENKLDCLIAHKLAAPFSKPAHHSHYNSRHISAQGEIVASALKQIQKHLTLEEIAQIILAYQNGRSSNDLAREYGCNRHTICEYLKKHGIEVSRSKIKNEGQSKEIVTLYECGHTAAEVAKITGRSTATIQRHLHEQGVKMRGRWG